MGSLLSQSKPSIACNGSFLYLQRGSQGIVKLGTGLKGTLRGHVYGHKDIAAGWLGLLGGKPMYRPHKCEATVVCYAMDPIDLEHHHAILIPESEKEVLSHETVAFSCGDGLIYRVRLDTTEHDASQKKTKPKSGSATPPPAPIPVVVDVFAVPELMSEEHTATLEVENVQDMGMELSTEVYAVVTSVKAGSKAERAGIRLGDSVIQINQTVCFKTEEVNAMLSTVLQRDEQATVQITLRRGVSCSLLRRVVLDVSSSEKADSPDAFAVAVDKSAPYLKAQAAPPPTGAGNPEAEKSKSLTTVGLSVRKTRAAVFFVHGQVITVMSRLGSTATLISQPGGRAFGAPSMPASAMAMPIYGGPSFSGSGHALSGPSRSCSFDQKSYSLATGSQCSTRRITDINDGALSATKVAQQDFGTATCVDEANEIIWVVNGEWIDQWAPAPGVMQATRQQHEKEAAAFNMNEAAASDISVVDTRNALSRFLEHDARTVLRHVALKEEKLKMLVANIVDILAWGIRDKDESAILCALNVLDVIFNCTPSSSQVSLLKNGAGSLTTIRNLLLECISSSSMTSERVAQRVCSVFVAIYHVLYSSSAEQYELLSKLSKDPTQQILLDALLLKCARDVGTDKSVFFPPERAAAVEFLDLVDVLMQQSVTANTAQFAALVDLKSQREEVVAFRHIRVLSALQSHLFSVLLCSENPDSEDPTTPVILEIRRIFRIYITKVLVSCLSVLDGFVEAKTSAKADADKVADDDFDHLQQQLEMALKCSLVGHLLPGIMTLQSTDWLLGDDATFTEELLPILTQLTSKLDLVSQFFPRDDEAEKQYNVPKPWSKGILLESIHPLRDNYKFNETVCIKGASCLYLTFDKRSSSQYDYDKVIIHSGAPKSPSFKKVKDPRTGQPAEYGGNAAGYGSRSVLGQGWPTSSLKVPGDTVTVSFDMRSGRESGTPDHAMWGFGITIRGQEDDGSTADMAFPFMTDLSLTVASWVCQLIRSEYKGPAALPSERTCSSMLRPSLLRFTWHDPTSVIPPDTLLSPKELQKAQEAGLTSADKNWRKMQSRLAFSKAVDLPTLEHAFISAMLNFTDQLLNTGDVDVDICTEYAPLFYRKYMTFLRDLQTCYSLEQSWFDAVEGEVNEETGGPFFSNWHLDELQQPRLKTLSRVLGVDSSNLEKAVADLLQLRTKEAEDEAIKSDGEKATRNAGTRTALVVSSVLERCALLLQAVPGAPHVPLMRQSDPDMDDGAQRLPRRSMSAPPVLEALTEDMSFSDDFSSPGPVNSAPALSASTVDDLFNFVTHGIFGGSKASPSTVDFQSTIKIRGERAHRRVNGLRWAEKMLMCTKDGESSEFMCKLVVESITSTLRDVVLDQDLGCCGRVDGLYEAFGTALRALVDTIQRQPTACLFGLSICLIPFAKIHAASISESRIVELLDKLCAQYDENRSTMTSAWAAFRVLALRCAEWEEDRPQQSPASPSGTHADAALGCLAKQIASFLSHHLMDAVEQNAAVSVDDPRGLTATGMYDLLALLDNLAGSRLGGVVVSQPRCILGLLRLLVVPWATPTTLHIVIRLLAVSLPRLHDDDCALEKILKTMLPSEELPEVSAECRTQTYVMKLLVVKLIQFVVPPCTSFAATAIKDCEDSIGMVSPSRAPSRPLVPEPVAASSDSQVNKPHTPAKASRSGSFVIRLHRRQDQSARDVFSLFLRIAPRRHASNLEGLSSNTSVVVFKGTFAQCAQYASEWAPIGLVFSVDPDGSEPVAPSSKGNTVTDDICRGLNAAIEQRPDARRHYVSAAVAGGIANGLIGLIQSLIARAEADTSPWVAAATAVLGCSISAVPRLAPVLACDDGIAPSSEQISAASEALVCLCVLGGFREDIHVGGHVLVGGNGMKATIGQVQSYDADQGTASVFFPSLEAPLQVPATSLQSAFEAPHKRVVSLVTSSFAACLESLVLTGEDAPPGRQSVNDAIAKEHAVSVAFAHRLLADLRTRACMVLCLRLRHHSMASNWIRESEKAYRTVMKLAVEAQDLGESSISRSEAKHASLRQVFFERQRPRLGKALESQPKERSPDLKFHAARTFPPCRALVLGNDRTSVKFVKPACEARETPQLSGLVVLTTEPILDTPEFYWEVTVKEVPKGDFFVHHLHSHTLEKVDRQNGWGCDGAELEDEEGCGHGMSETDGLGRYRCVEGCDFDLCEECIDEGSRYAPFAVGYTPQPPQMSGPYEPWQWPAGAALVNAGKRILPTQQSLDELDFPDEMEDADDDGSESKSFAPGDVIGCLWNKNESTMSFFCNGDQLGSSVKGLQRGGYPVVHLRVPGCELAANFGSKPFQYPRNDTSATATPAKSDSNEDTLDESAAQIDFAVLSSARYTGDGTQDTAELYELPCHGGMAGASNVVVGEVDIEPEEDMTAKLIKEWVKVVFPKIQQRFRNSSERREGEGQIKGALQFGMYEVAVDTVNMLYEDNGGMPADMHLPTVEDLKKASKKLDPNALQRGTRVHIDTKDERTGFEVSDMKVTRQLSGTIVNVDTARSLALVAVYLEGDALLTQWWYPVQVLQKADKGLGNNAADHAELSKQLLQNSSDLTRQYCRSAVLQVKSHGLVDEAILSKPQSLRLLANELKRPEIPGRCLVDSATANVFFNLVAGNEGILTDAMTGTLAHATKQSAGEQLIGDLCGCLDASNTANSFNVVELCVAKGRKGVDVQFPLRSSSVLVSLRAPASGGKAFKQPLSPEEPWLRIYAGDNAKGPRSAVVPCSDAGPVAAPYLLLQSARLHVRCFSELCNIYLSLSCCLTKLHRSW